MKKLIALVVASGLFLTTSAQESMEKVMEKRAREMHRVLGLTSKDEWKKFVKENYSQTLIDKPMRAQIAEGNSGTTVEGKAADNLEGKAMMLERLHEDFGGSKIVSIKSEGEIIKMVLENDQGQSGTFQLKFNKVKPYLIDGLGIEVGN